jgi:TPR repeat protein
MEVAASLESDDATTADRAQAVVLYRQACDWGHVPACIRAGHRLRSGKDIAHDQSSAIELFHTACEGGGPEGCNMLGIMYANGEGGLSTDIARARQLYLRACSDGWAWGCYNVATRMRDGEGGEQDLAGAATRFGTACDSGIADACNALGNMYWNGNGVGQDQLRANMYYTKGCDGDAAWACYNLGTSYRNGEGVLAKDLDRAAELLRTACELGVAQGCNLAGIIHHDGETGTKDRLLAFGLFHKACDDGYHWGCNNMASMYREGRGIGQDEERAVALFRKACDGGIADACEAIGATSEAAVAQATPTPAPTATPRPTASPRPRPPRAKTPPPAATRWQRNCHVVWSSRNELVYTGTTQVTDGEDGETSWHVNRSDLLALVNELDVTGETELTQARQAALRAIEQAPAYDNPLSSIAGGSDADMTISPILSKALDVLWELVDRRATAAGEPCPHVRFDAGDDGIMHDTKTNLEWLAGPDERTIRDDAVAWVDGLVVAGGGWRLPTKTELHDLYTGGLNPRNMSSFLNMTGTWVWTASEDGGPSESWGYSFAREGSMVMTGCRNCDSRAFAVRQRRQ